MAITFACKSCGGKLQVPDGAAGRTTSCPKCKTSLTVPGEKIDLPRGAPAPAPPSGRASEGTPFAGRTSDASPLAGRASAAPPAPAKQVPCPACGAVNLETAKNCRQCGETLDARLRAPRPASSPGQDAAGQSPLGIPGAAHEDGDVHSEAKARSRHKHKKHAGAGGINLGLIITPMLDMSFQILAFFIMTYHPAAMEGHIPGSLVPPEDYAKKSKDNTPVPVEQNLSVPDDLLDPSLNEAITVMVKSVVKGQEIGTRTEGSPAQIFIRTTLETEKTLIAEMDVPIEQAMKLLEARLKDMAKKGASKANLKIAADGDLRQQYVMMVYDTCKKAGFDKLHFVPPPVLNAKIKQ